jgi:hypothetical protein
MFPVGPAGAVFEYQEEDFDFGGAKSDTGVFKVVYFSFGFEAINNQQDRNIIMKRTLKWLTGNEPPIAIGNSYSIRKNNQLNVAPPGVLYNDIDEDGPNPLTAELVNDVSHGMLNLYSDGSFVYNPNNGYTGTDYFTYKAFDGEDYSREVAVTITVRSGGPTCFLKGTSISMADGSLKNIEDIRIGDIVVAYDENNKKIVQSKVTDVFHHKADEMTDYYLIINGKIKVTPNHLLFINNDWEYAGKAKIGDNLLDIDGEHKLIYSIGTVLNKVPTYNFEVETYHNYFAEEILAHNQKLPCQMYIRDGDPGWD